MILGGKNRIRGENISSKKKNQKKWKVCKDGRNDSQFINKIYTESKHLCTKLP